MMDNAEGNIFQITSRYAGDSVVVCLSAQLVGCHMAGVHFYCVASGQEFGHLEVKRISHFFKKIIYQIKWLEIDISSKESVLPLSLELI